MVYNGAIMYIKCENGRGHAIKRGGTVAKRLKNLWRDLDGSYFGWVDRILWLTRWPNRVKL